MERSRELLFTQLESMGVFQSALWEPWFKQLSTGPASPPAGNTRRKGGQVD